MIKKVFVGMTIALVLFAGIFAFAKTSFAQDDSTEVETEELETPVMEALEYENQYQNGANSDEVDAIMTQTRIRTRELVESGECTGECTGDCDPIQQRLQDGSGVGSGGPQQNSNLGVDKWNATGVSQGDGPNNGAGTRGGTQGVGNQGNGMGDPENCPNNVTP